MEIEKILVNEVFGKDGYANIYIDKFNVDEKVIYVVNTDDYGFDCRWDIEVQNELLVVVKVTDDEGSANFNMTLQDYIKKVLN